MGDVRRHREERKFPSLATLQAQIAEDCREARRVLNKVSG